MARAINHDAGCVAFDGRPFFDRAAAFLTPDGLERFKLDRLLEMRAFIDSVRREREQGLLDDVRAEAIRNS
jgi:hypothetical protein